MRTKPRKTWDQLGEPTWDADRDAGDRCFLMPREVVLAFPERFPEQYAAITRAKDPASGTASDPAPVPSPKAE